MYAEDFIRSVVEETDIVSVVSKYVPLKKRGGNYFACCPFHSENTPSFTVNPKKKFYFCFGCGASGDVVSFVMEQEGTGFHETVAELARNLGKELPDLDKQEMQRLAKERQQKKTLSETNAAAGRYYREVLSNDNEALDYLIERGISQSTLAHFNVGYAPPEYNHLADVFPVYPSNELLSAGLMKSNEEKGSIYDTFRNRIVFPIRNTAGLVLGFGGRLLPLREDPLSTQPKYINTQDTVVFRKREVLYGLYECRQLIREQGKAYITEGYMDVLAMYEHGLPAVAVMGTAFQDTQYDLLHSHTRRMIFIFDGDKAGLAAGWRAMQECLKKVGPTDNIGFCLLPDGKDVADIAAALPAGVSLDESLQPYTVSLADFFISKLKKDYDTSTPEGQSGMINQARFLMKELKDRVLSEILNSKIAEAAGTATSLVKNATGKRYKRNWQEDLEAVSKGMPLGVNLLERILLSSLCNPPYIVHHDMGQFDLICPENDEAAGLINLLFELKDHLSALPSELTGRREISEYWKHEKPQWYETISPYLTKANPNIYKMPESQFNALFNSFLQKQQQASLAEICNQLREKLKDGSATEQDKEMLLHYMTLI